MIHASLINPRIIIAGIRNLGGCPCPQCLILLDRVHNIGWPQNIKECSSLAHVDNVTCHTHVESACSAIYKKNYTVNSNAVENLLWKQSLVPMTICISFYIFTIYAYSVLHRTHSRKN